MKQPRKGRKFLFVMYDLANLKLIKEGPGVSVERIFAKRSRLDVIFDERVSRLNHEMHALLRRNIEAWFIKGRNAKSLCGRSLLTKLHKKRDHTLMLDHHHVNSTVAWIGHSRDGSQKI